IMGVGAIMESGLIPALGKGAVAMAKMGARAIVWGAEMLASGFEAMLPFLPFIAVVAAVGVAAYLLYKNWDTVWAGIKSVTSIAFNWIKSHLDLIITVGLGPLGLAIVFLKDHWSQIWSTIQSVTSGAWNFLSVVFNAIKNVGIAGVMWEIQGFQTVWGGVWGTVQSVVSGAWGVISGIINNIESAIGGVASTIGSALKSIPGLSSIGHALHIPGFASGVTDFQGGLALVGERGPELRYLPPHSSIIPNGPTMAALTHATARGNGAALHIENYYEAKAPIGQIASDLMFKMAHA
ncbi:MAG: hypothetical protein ACXVXZ_03420, partial [Mycobacteriaceae bacterium]